MFFGTWWQGIIFGVITTVALLAIGYAFTAMWKPYEDGERKRFPDTHDAHDSHGCQAHH